MKMRHFCINWACRIAVAGAAGLVATNLYAQGTISATGTLTETGQVGGEFEYSLSLDNTGTVPIEAFWYGWIQGSFNLPTPPSSITAPTGWTSTPDNVGSANNSVQFSFGTGSAIAPGTTGIFTFDSTSSPSALTTAPAGESVAYSAPSFMSSFDQSDPGHATGPIQVTLSSVPEPSAIGLLGMGLTAVSFWRARRRSA
jgi:PEP-CTERM motif